MKAVFERRISLVGDFVSVGCAIYEREAGDTRPVDVQVSVSSCRSDVQASFTFYVKDESELIVLAEQIKQAGVALAYAKKFAAKVGEING